MSHQLSQLAAEVGIHLSDDQVQLLARYCQLLWDWNTRINLTRHTDWEKFVYRDLLDSYQLAKCLALGERVLDVGSGGGVPGIVLAILRPDLQVVLSESVTKKARVLEEIVGQLGLPVRVFAERGEAVVAREPFDAVLFRGVGGMARILRWFAPTWGHLGRMLMVKGPKWVEERGEARHHGLLRGLELRRVADYPMPGTSSHSVILAIRPRPEDSAEPEEPAEVPAEPVKESTKEPVRAPATGRPKRGQK
ncbi:MAG: 16S rRNA (guanine(527)-N(7))-methyltransferase RsmG [Pirellulales bacterium]